MGDLGGQDGERPTASLIPRQQPTSGLSPAQSRIRRRASGIDTFDTEELGRSEPSAAAANHHTKPKKVKPFVAAVAVVAALVRRQKPLPRPIFSLRASVTETTVLRPFSQRRDLTSWASGFKGTTPREGRVRALCFELPSLHARIRANEG